MATAAMTPDAKASPPRANATFGNVLASEWTKIRTVKSTYWTIISGLVVTIGFSVLMAWGFIVSWEQQSEADRASFDPVAFGTIGVLLGMMAFAVLGAMVITTEYSTGMIRTSLTAVPKRTRFVLAKGLILAVLSFVVGLVAGFGSFLLSQLVFASKDLDASLSDPGVLRAVIGVGLFLMMITLFSFGLGLILRHTAGAITAALGLLFVVWMIGNFLPSEWGETVRKYLPYNAGSSIMGVGTIEPYLSPWAGFWVFTAYTVVLVVCGYVLFTRRDA